MNATIPGRAAVLALMIAAGHESRAEKQCGIAFAANHQKDAASDADARPHLSVDLLRSEFRVGNEPWRSTQELCSVDRLDLAEGETAAVSCRTDLACGRYQFLFRIDALRSSGELIGSRFIAFPARGGAVEVHRSRTVQLGNVRELFDAQQTASGPRQRAADAAPKD